MNTKFEYAQAKEIKNNMQADLSQMSNYFKQFREISKLAGVWTGSSANATTTKVEEYAELFPKFENRTQSLINELGAVITAHEKLEEEQANASRNLM